MFNQIAGLNPSAMAFFDRPEGYLSVVNGGQNSYNVLVLVLKVPMVLRSSAAVLGTLPVTILSPLAAPLRRTGALLQPELALEFFYELAIPLSWTSCSAFAPVQRVDYRKLPDLSGCWSGKGELKQPTHNGLNTVDAGSKRFDTVVTSYLAVLSGEYHQSSMEKSPFSQP